MTEHGADIEAGDDLLERLSRALERAAHDRAPGPPYRVTAPATTEEDDPVVVERPDAPRRFGSRRLPDTPSPDPAGRPAPRLHLALTAGDPAPHAPTGESGPDRTLAEHDRRLEALERRARAHQSRLDSVAVRLSATALRVAAAQAAEEGRITGESHAMAARTGRLTAGEAARPDEHERAMLLAALERAGEERAELRALLERAERSRQKDRQRLQELAEALTATQDQVAAAVAKTRAQAGQITKLRNQLKDLADPPPPTPAARRRSPR